MVHSRVQYVQRNVILAIMWCISLYLFKSYGLGKL